MCDLLRPVTPEREGNACARRSIGLTCGERGRCRSSAAAERSDGCRILGSSTVSKQRPTPETTTGVHPAALGNALSESTVYAVDEFGRERHVRRRQVFGVTI